MNRERQDGSNALNHSPPVDDLAELFAEQRREERIWAPDFDRCIQTKNGARHSQGFWRWRWGLALAAILTMVTVLWWHPEAVPPDSESLELAVKSELNTTWSAPTDFLLQGSMGSGADGEIQFETDFLISVDTLGFLDEAPSKTDRSLRYPS